MFEIDDKVRIDGKIVHITGDNGHEYRVGLKTFGNIHHEWWPIDDLNERGELEPLRRGGSD